MSQYILYTKDATSVDNGINNHQKMPHFMCDHNIIIYKVNSKYNFEKDFNFIF